MKFEELKEKMLSDDAFREEYYRKDLRFQVSQMVFDARVTKGFTQGELAKKIGTKQPSIARVENGTALPSLSFLEKIASALGTYLIPPTFGFMKGYHDEVYNYDGDITMDTAVSKINTGFSNGNIFVSSNKDNQVWNVPNLSHKVAVATSAR